MRNFDRIREYLKLKEKLMSEITSKPTFKHDSVPKISAAPVNKFLSNLPSKKFASA